MRLLLSSLVMLWVAAAHAEGPLPEILRNTAIQQRLDAQVPLDLTFRDEADAIVTLGEVAGGKPVILVLAYFRCPMLCNQVLNGLLTCLSQVAFDVGDRFEVIVVSMDARETPALAAAKKASMMEGYGRGRGGWHFLTGQQEHISRLAQAVGIRFAYDPRQDQFSHPSAVTILTPGGRVSRYFLGIDYAPLDMRLALVEAGEGAIGSPVDRAMLLCYSFDNAAGRYTSVVLTFVRIGGVLTVLTIGFYLFRSRRREPTGVT